MYKRQDVVLGNVPFGEIRVNDSRYNAQKFLIHDYFFAKALDKVRVGGVVMLSLIHIFIPDIRTGQLFSAMSVSARF